MVVTQICIDLSGKYRYEYVVAKQGDADSRLIQVTLLSDSRIYVIDDQTTARVSITKPDKTEVIQDCTVNNNMVEIVLEANMLAVAGIAAAEILLSDPAGTVTSASFDIKVIATNTGKNAESSDDYQSFKDALAKCDGMAEKQEVNAIKHRISNLVLNANGDSNAEVVDARVSKNGTVYATLKERLDSENGVTVKEEVVEFPNDSGVIVVGEVLQI